MEEVEKFYLKVIAELKYLQSERMNKEKFLPTEVHVYEKIKNTWLATRIAKKKEKQRKKIEKGYYKAINECIKHVNDIYKETLKECSKD